MFHLHVKAFNQVSTIFQPYFNIALLTSFTHNISTQYQHSLSVLSTYLTFNAAYFNVFNPPGSLMQTTSVHGAGSLARAPIFSADAGPAALRPFFPIHLSNRRVPPPPAVRDAPAAAALAGTRWTGGAMSVRAVGPTCSGAPAAPSGAARGDASGGAEAGSLDGHRGEAKGAPANRPRAEPAPGRFRAEGGEPATPRRVGGAGGCRCSRARARGARGARGAPDVPADKGGARLLGLGPPWFSSRPSRRGQDADWG